jgi:hypothetical protein
MSFGLTLSRLNGSTRQFDDRLLDVDIARTHTGLSDFEATVPREPSLEGAIFADVKIASDGTVLFRGQLEEVRSQFEAGTTTLTGRGRGVELTDEESVVRFQNRFVHNAIEEFVTEQTAFDADITTPTANVTFEDRQARLVDTAADFRELSDIPDTQPIVIEDAGTLRPAQTAFVREAEDVFTLSGAISDPAASAGEAETIIANSGFTDDFTFATEHTIPAADAEVQLRLRADDDPDNDGVFETPGVTVEVDGESVFSLNGGPLTNVDEFQLFSGTGLSDPLQPGTHTLSVTETGGTSGTAIDLDVVVVGDRRFTDAIPSLGSADRLSGPAEFPTVATQLGTIDVPLRVAEVNVDASLLSGGPLDELEARLVGGSFQGARDTTSIAVSPSAPSTQIQLRVTTGPDGQTRTDGTPTQDFSATVLDTLDVRIDGDGLGVIDDRRFEGSGSTFCNDSRRPAGCVSRSRTTCRTPTSELKRFGPRMTCAHCRT